MASRVVGGVEEGGEVVTQMGKTLKEGERIEGPTRRPDGTLRKPVRIRAGYVPQDEVAIYQSKGALWRKEMESQVGPPGYDPETQAKPKSKSVKRNERRKEKKQQAAPERTKNSEHPEDEINEKNDYPRNSGSMSEAVKSLDSQISQLSIAGNTSSNPTDGLNTPNAGVEINKKIRALKKKIRLAQAQVQKASPDETNKPEHAERIKKLQGWHEELNLLEGELAVDSSTS